MTIQKNQHTDTKVQQDSMTWGSLFPTAHPPTVRKPLWSAGHEGVALGL